MERLDLLTISTFAGYIVGAVVTCLLGMAIDRNASYGVCAFWTFVVGCPAGAILGNLICRLFVRKA